MFLFYDVNNVFVLQTGLIPNFDGAKIERNSVIPKYCERNCEYLDGIKIENPGSAAPPFLLSQAFPAGAARRRTARVRPLFSHLTSTYSSDMYSWTPMT